MSISYATSVIIKVREINKITIKESKTNLKKIISNIYIKIHFKALRSAYVKNPVMSQLLEPINDVEQGMTVCVYIYIYIYIYI